MPTLIKLIDPIWKKDEIKRIGFRLTLLLASFLPGQLLADKWVLEPSVSLEGSYDDNFRLAPEAPDKVFGLNVAPYLKLSRSTDTTEIDGLVGLEFVSYTGDTDTLSDKHNQFLRISAKRKGETNVLGILGSLRRDSILRSIDDSVDPEDEIELGNLGDDEGVDNSLVRVNARRNRFNIKPSWTHTLTERMTVGIDYTFDKTIYGNAGDAELFDFDKHEVTGKLRRSITERDQFVASLLATKFESDSDRKFDDYELQVGVSHNFDETTNVTMTLGGRTTSFETKTEDGDDTGFVARLNGSKLTGLTKFNAKLERTLSPSGIGDMVRTDEFSFKIARKMSEYTLFSTDFRLFENKSIRTISSRANRRYLTLEPKLSWNLTRSLTLQSSYRYRRQKRFSEPESADSSAVFFKLIYQRPTLLDDAVGF